MSNAAIAEMEAVHESLKSLFADAREREMLILAEAYGNAAIRIGFEILGRLEQQNRLHR